METAAGSFAAEPLALVEVELEGGGSGRAYVRCYSGLLLQPLMGLIDALGRLVIGTPAEPGRVNSVLDAELRLAGDTGLSRLARSAIDMALWDALAADAGLSLARMLGGEERPLPVYATLRSMDAERAAAEAAARAAEGFGGVKLKLGHGDLRQDLGAIAAVRRQIGDLSVMVDYNGVLTPDEARQRLEALDDQGLTWIEDPLDSFDTAALTAVASALATPVAAGERWETTTHLRNALDGIDQVLLDAGRVGGVSGWLRMAGVSRSAARPISNHAYPEVSLQLLCATGGGWLEMGGGAASVLAGSVRVEGGYAHPPAEPGSGLRWAETW